MDASQQSTTQTACRESRATRWYHAHHLEHATKIGFWWHSPRQVAQQLGIPESSFRYGWQQQQRRRQQSRCPRSFFEFCESPQGLEFLHRLTTPKLGALRVLHNYVVERRDGTTAAERFFGQRPQPLLPWLLTRLPLPDRPRKRRQAA